MQARFGGHRAEAPRLALRDRPVGLLAQDQEPGRARGAAAGGGGLINMTQKKPRRGRPAGGPLIGVRLPRELIEAIDE